jgi:putative ABC transport system permease protein
VNLLVTFRIAIRALSRNTLRAALTMLGIIIGVGAVIATVALGQGAQHAVSAQIAALGVNMLMVSPGSQAMGGHRLGAGTLTTLTVDDARAIREECPSVAEVCETVGTSAQAIFGNQNWSTRMTGTGANYTAVKDWEVGEGDFFTEQDVRSAVKVCVIGKTVADALFEDASPVGQVIRIRKFPFRVVGVLAEKGQSTWGQDQDDIVVAPYTTVQKKLLAIAHLHGVQASALDEEAIDQASAEIGDLLRRRHRMADGEDDDFTIRTQKDIASAFEGTARTMQLLLLGIASVSLLVGGIGIMNIMLVSVTERTREIGIRLAIGARARDILVQFLVEAVVITAAGGILGLGLGTAASFAITRLMTWPTVVSPAVMVLAVGFSATIGIFFGFYPAWKASALNPIDALRYE